MSNNGDKALKKAMTNKFFESLSLPTKKQVYSLATQDIAVMVAKHGSKETVFPVQVGKDFTLYADELLAGDTRLVRTSATNEFKLEAKVLTSKKIMQMGVLPPESTDVTAVNGLLRFNTGKTVTILDWRSLLLRFKDAKNHIMAAYITKAISDNRDLLR